MKSRYLFFLIFITALSLLLSSLISREQVEKVRADDYSTYIHPGPSTTHITSSLAQQISELPVAIFHFVFFTKSLGTGKSLAQASSRYLLAPIPIYLSYCQILI